MRERGVFAVLAGASGGDATAAESAAACICRELLRRQTTIESLLSWADFSPNAHCNNLSQSFPGRSEIRIELAQDLALFDPVNDGRPIFGGKPCSFSRKTQKARTCGPGFLTRTLCPDSNIS